MELIREAARLRARLDEVRSDGATVGFVPTMGALHEGHLSLIRRSVAEHDHTAVSIFVNPEQFGPGEDFDRYPRDEEADLAAAEAAGAGIVWVPPMEEVYPPGVTLPQPDPGPVGELFEGADRSGHFAGVLKVVHRLFDVAGPSEAYFGEKDAQQLFLVRRMVQGEGLPVHITACPTAREVDGLALSSRNTRLTPEERGQAGCLFLGLSEAAAMARGGEVEVPRLVAVIAREVGATPLARLAYAAVVDEATFLPLEVVDRPARALVAAAFGSTRLIDNLVLPMPPPPDVG